MANKVEPPQNPERDQVPSPFAPILDAFCERTGAECAALVDDEGETVDYAGSGDPFLIRILAAELGLLLKHLRAGNVHATTSHLFIRARRKSFAVQALPHGYALVARLPRRAAQVSRRAVTAAIVALCEEAGFDTGPSSQPSETWLAVDVDESAPHSRRPTVLRSGGESLPIEVLGRLAGGADFPELREQGYRVRLASGQEGTLVREPLGRWYLGEDG